MWKGCTIPEPGLHGQATGAKSEEVPPGGYCPWRVISPCLWLRTETKNETSYQRS